MMYYHGQNKKCSYFEGWYFKLQGQDGTAAFIPGMSADENGRKAAFVQVITAESSLYAEYPFRDFYANPQKLYIKIGPNVFCEQGIMLDMNVEGRAISGTVTFGPVTPLSYNIMGPFAAFPNLECNHGVLSMRHRLRGSLTLDGKPFDFEKGTGYIETDWGSSFPKGYVWMQCNDFDREDVSFFASCARIPFLGREFDGLIASLLTGGKELRFATYNGARCERTDENGLLLTKGGYILEALPELSEAQNLKAPDAGNMRRLVRQQASCGLTLRLYKDDHLLLETRGRSAGYESSTKDG